MQLCPICAVEARATTVLGSDEIRARLTEEFGAAVPRALPPNVDPPGRAP